MSRSLFSTLGAAADVFSKRNPVRPGPPPKDFPAIEAVEWARQRQLVEREAEMRRGRGR